MAKDVNLSLCFPLALASAPSGGDRRRLNERDMQIRVGLRSILIARGVNGMLRSIVDR